MEFEHPEYKTTFELPDKPTVRQMLEYEAEIERPGVAMYERLWPAAKKLIQNWKSEATQLDVDIDGEYTPEAVAVIKWASLAVFSWNLQLKEVPKNA
jgi:hypothetical protein